MPWPWQLRRKKPKAACLVSMIVVEHVDCGLLSLRMTMVCYSACSLLSFVHAHRSQVAAPRSRRRPRRVDLSLKKPQVVFCFHDSLTLSMYLRMSILAVVLLFLLALACAAI